jgi:hypothetical protein
MRLVGVPLSLPFPISSRIYRLQRTLVLLLLSYFQLIWFVSLCVSIYFLVFLLLSNFLETTSPHIHPPPDPLLIVSSRISFVPYCASSIVAVLLFRLSATFLACSFPPMNEVDLSLCLCLTLPNINLHLTTIRYSVAFLLSFFIFFPWSSNITMSVHSPRQVLEPFLYDLIDLDCSSYSNIPNM